MKVLFAILLTLPILIWGTFRVTNSILFDKDCEGYLKRAADANTVAQAEKELTIALAYMEGHGLTKGYTSVIYQTPDEDIAFWYNNIKSAKAELEKVTDETTALERTNMLMKLRETLLDNGEKKDNVTVPAGISIYPNNVTYTWLGLLSLLCLLASFYLWFLVGDEY